MSPSEADLLKNILIGISFAFNLIATAVLAWSRLTGKPDRQEITNSPLQVKGVSDPVTQEHCKLVHQNQDARLDAMDESIAELYQLLRGVSETVANIKGTIEPLKNLATKFSQDVGRLEGILQRRN